MEPIGFFLKFIEKLTFQKLIVERNGLQIYFFVILQKKNTYLEVVLWKHIRI